MSQQTIKILRATASSWPDKIAVYHNEETTTYKTLNEESEKLSKILSETINITGKGIALLAGNNIHFITGLFACSGAGLVVMPIWKSLAAVEIEKAIEEASINLVLIEKTNNPIFEKENIRSTINENFDLITFPKTNSELITAKFPGAAFIRPSSGTTGNSKGVVISHRAVLERIEAANLGLQLNEEDRILWVLPMAFHFIVSIILYVKYGAGIIILDEFFAELIIEQSNRYKATLLYASPLHYRLLVATGTNKKFTTMKITICTSAVIETKTIEKFQKKFNLPLCQAYGIIEIGLPLINRNLIPQKLQSVGQALPSYDINVYDDKMNVLPVNTSGMFAIKGPGMFSGYLWPFQKAEDVLKDSWFLTGDIAKIDEEGFVTICGRSKSVISVSGNKVFPEEVENVLRLHPQIVDARVYKGSHPLTGEIVEAEMVLLEGSTLTSSEIISFCRKHLAAIKIPQHIMFVNKIKKTNTDKTIRI